MSKERVGTLQTVAAQTTLGTMQLIEEWEQIRLKYIYKTNEILENLCYGSPVMVSEMINGFIPHLVSDEISRPIYLRGVPSPFCTLHTPSRVHHTETVGLTDLRNNRKEIMDRAILGESFGLLSRTRLVAVLGPATPEAKLIMLLYGLKI